MKLIYLLNQKKQRIYLRLDNVFKQLKANIIHSIKNNKISLFSKIYHNKKVPKVKMKVKTNQTKIQVIQNYLKVRIDKRVEKRREKEVN